MKIYEQGFSLFELIIVLLIIALAAVIAVPNISATRRSANEGSAISSLKVLHKAQIVYKTTSGAGNYDCITKPVDFGADPASATASNALPFEAY